MFYTYTVDGITKVAYEGHEAHWEMENAPQTLIDWMEQAVRHANAGNRTLLNILVTGRP